MLHLFWSGAGSEGLEEIGSICSSEKPVSTPPKRTSIFQLRWEADVGWVTVFVCDRSLRWPCPLQGGALSCGPFGLRQCEQGSSRSFQRASEACNCGEHGSTRRFGFFWVLWAEWEFQERLSNAANCVRWNSQPSLGNCWAGPTPKPKLITLNEQKL